MCSQQQAFQQLLLRLRFVPFAQGNDAMFGKFISLHQGDKFVDPKRAELLAKAESKKKNVSEAPFRAASPMKRSAAPGDYFGTISGKVLHEPVSGTPALGCCMQQCHATETQ